MTEINPQQFGEMVGAVKTNTGHVDELRGDMKTIKEVTLPDMRKESQERYDKLKWLIIITSVGTTVIGYDSGLIQQIIAYIGTLFT